MDVLAAVVQYTNTPVDSSNVATTGSVGATPQIGIFQGQLTIPDPFNLAGLRFFGLSKPSDTSMRMRMVNPSNVFVDCQTEWFDPTSALPVWGGGSPPTPTEVKDNGATITLTFSGSQCSVGSATSYYMYGEREDNPGVQEYSQLYTAKSVWNNGYFLYELSDTPFPPDETRTRIISVFPPDDPDFSSPYATSTAFDINGTGYVNEEDYVSGMVFRQRYFNNVKAATLAAGPSFSEGGNILCNAMPSWLCPREEEFVPTGTASGQFDYPIEGPGEFSFATTSDIQVIGRYTLVSQIIRPSFVFGFIPGGDSIFVGTTTHFEVVEASSYDKLVGETIEKIQDLQDAASAECSFDFTTPGNFLPGIQECIVAIMQPAYDYVIAQMMTAITGFLSHAPWGYGMRLYTVFTTESTSTSTLPSFAFTIPVGPQEGATFDFTPWEYLAGSSSPLAHGEAPDGTPVLPILLYWWNILCYTMYGAGLFAFFFGLNPKHHDDDD